MDRSGTGRSRRAARSRLLNRQRDCRAQERQLRRHHHPVFPSWCEWHSRVPSAARSPRHRVRLLRQSETAPEVLESARPVQHAVSRARRPGEDVPRCLIARCDHRRGVQDARLMAPCESSCSRSASLPTDRRIRRLQLARHDRQDHRAQWQPSGCEGPDSRSGVDCVEWSPRCDRVRRRRRHERDGAHCSLRARLTPAQSGAIVGFLEWDANRGKGIDDHLAIVGPEMVLEEIAHVDFTGSSWKKDLLRSKPPMNHCEGRILPVLANAIAAFRHAPEWGGVLAFNEFLLGTVALKATPWGVVPKGEWTDHEDRRAAEWLQKQGILVSVEVAGQAVQTAARDHPFHPVRAYLDCLIWDGVERLDRWLSTYLGVADTEYACAVGSRWMISAVARIFRPGAKADCCLILEGPQGIRKSTALRTLAGEYFTDELADLGTKDAAMQTRGVWIIELSELDSLSNSEVARIKAFMSRTTDRFRPPYGMRLVESPRQCVFAGTVNHSTYLRDETGGRRFWPLTCGRIDIEALARDRDQLWAEAKARFDAGAPWWLESAELVQLASEEQLQRYEGDPWEEIIGPWLEARSSVSDSEVLQKCLEKPQAMWTQSDKNRAARCLRALGWERYRERQGTRLEWRYRKGE